MAQSSSLRTPQHASRVVPGDPRGGKHRHFIVYFTRFFAHPMFYVLRGTRWPQDGHKMAKERPKIPKRAPETPPETSQDGPKVGIIIDPWDSLAILGRLGGLLGYFGPSWGLSWAVLGASWGLLGPSWGGLGAVLGRLGSLLEGLWAVLGPSWRKKGRLG